MRLLQNSKPLLLKREGSPGLIKPASPEREIHDFRNIRVVVKFTDTKAPAQFLPFKLLPSIVNIRFGFFPHVRYRLFCERDNAFEVRVVSIGSNTISSRLNCSAGGGGSLPEATSIVSLYGVRGRRSKRTTMRRSRGNVFPVMLHATGAMFSRISQGMHSGKRKLRVTPWPAPAA